MNDIASNRHLNPAYWTLALAYGIVDIPFFIFFGFLGLSYSIIVGFLTIYIVNSSKTASHAISISTMALVIYIVPINIAIELMIKWSIRIDYGDGINISTFIGDLLVYWPVILIRGLFFFLTTTIVLFLIFKSRRGTADAEVSAR